MRADGKRVKNVDNMYTIAPYIMKERSDACNAITVYIPYEPMHQYINAVRKEGHDVSYLALIISAYVRMISQYPALNRFVVNKRIYARNEIAVGMVVQRADDMQGTMSKMKFGHTDTLFEISNKINEYVSENRQENSNSTDKLMNILTRIPFVLGMGVGLIKLMDKYGLLPKSVIDMSPFHNSFVISNLASIRTNHIFHHIYNFGTTSSILTIGTSEEHPYVKDGEIKLARQMPLGFVLDERCCSGAYYAKALRLMLKLLKNPKLLETPPEKVNLDF